MVLLVALVIFLVLERIIPFQKAPFIKKGMVSDVGWYLILQPQVLQVCLYNHISFGFVTGRDISRLPIYVQFLLTFLLLEFLFYWFHRFVHYSNTMWRFHEVHHSITDVNCFSAARNHFVDVIIGFSITGIVFSIYSGVDIAVISFIGIFNGLHSFYKHSNVKIKTGPLQYLIVSSEMHRAHHIKDIKYQKSNYGNILSLWDWIYGTAYYPKEEEYKSLSFGTDTEDYPQNFIKQNIYVFRRKSAN